MIDHFEKRRWVVAALLLVLTIVLIALPKGTHAEGASFIVHQGIGGKFGSWAVSPPASSTAGTGIACNSGTSPCTVTTTATAGNQNILNSNTSRKGCSVCTVGVVDLYCKRATFAGSAASSSSFDFMLNAGSGALKNGQCWPCDSPGGVWQGAVNCVSSAASAVADVSVSETQ